MDFPDFVRNRIKDINAEILALEAGHVGERNADSLGIDVCFYETALEVWVEYVAEGGGVA